MTLITVPGIRYHSDPTAKMAIAHQDHASPAAVVPGLIPRQQRHRSLRLRRGRRQGRRGGVP